jgi:hypothetical protein
MFKFYIKFSNDFGKGGTYIVYKWIHLSYSFEMELHCHFFLKKVGFLFLNT